jgi:hypothetical protein
MLKEKVVKTPLLSYKLLSSGMNKYLVAVLPKLFIQILPLLFSKI